MRNLTIQSGSNAGTKQVVKKNVDIWIVEIRKFGLEIQSIEHYKRLNDL